MLALIFVAVVGFGFLTAWFNARTHVGRAATILMLVLCVGLALLQYQRAGVAGW